MNSFIIARVDYCNSLLAGLPVYQTDHIQTVLNNAARLVLGGSRWDHATPFLRDRLHWLRAPPRIKFKVALLVYKAINNLAPDYITIYCRFSSTNDRRSINNLAPDYITIYCRSSSTNDRRSTLRSADKAILIKPKTETEFGK